MTVHVIQCSLGGVQHSKIDEHCFGDIVCSQCSKFRSCSRIEFQAESDVQYTEIGPCLAVSK